MQESSLDQDRISDKTGLLLKFNYVSSFLSLILGFISLYALHIKGTITFVFFLYFALNLVNIGLFKIHRNLILMAVYTSILSLLSTLAITLFSGGINSPFIFILALIVLAGYVSTRLFGKIYLYAITVLVILIFAVDQAGFSFVINEIPDDSRDVFSLASILFAVYLLGGVFGKELLATHHNLYRSKVEIEKGIEEKEILLKEVHHRVKNNLQTVSSLLSLQSKNTLNQELQALNKSSQNRITAMAMIHEMLYVSDNLSKIEFRQYVRKLTENLIKSEDNTGKNVEIKIEMAEIRLSIDAAIPLGLLINEVITNSLKFGFAETETGQIDIRLWTEADTGFYHMDISDNGVGFSKKIDFNNTKSLGLKLIHNLSRQLRGSVQRMDTTLGTTYHIKFQDFERQITAR